MEILEVKSMVYKIGATIYAYRKMKGMTQEQLAEVMGVTGVSVSKWERGISIPDIELLCSLADYFGITVDELLGRADSSVELKSSYTEEELISFELGQGLIKYCEISRNKGVLAMEVAITEGKQDEFLEFSIKFLLDGMQRGLSNDFLFGLLENYAKHEVQQERACMVLDALKAIVSGENEECLKEIVASHIGRKYREKFISRSNESYNRESILSNYNEREGTYVLEVLSDCADRDIQMILKNIDNGTLVKALYGASGRICQKFLQNVSDRMLRFLDEDIQRFVGDEAEVLEAQKKVLEIALWLGVAEMQADK